MSACTEFAPLVEARLTESLGAEAARLEEHVLTCTACRAEVASQDELLGLARLPSPSADELRALEGLPLLTWKAMERARVRRLSLWGGGIGLGIAAALAFVIAIPRFGTPGLSRNEQVAAAKLTPPVADSASSDEMTELDLDMAADDEAVDLEDFASLDVAPSVGTAQAASDDDDNDDDGAAVQGEEL
jgi:hypothetical protein